MNLLYEAFNMLIGVPQKNKIMSPHSQEDGIYSKDRADRSGDADTAIR